MTEDEAFIRAVVDHPGDDTPRLVYADWLDDRSDPRGSYLRAELEWAKPWRAGERPAESPELREQARGLDPVWVARVSRPPVGVCCEHVRFDDKGPRLSVTDMDEVEHRIGVQVPADYRAFLLNYNGGTPTPHDVKTHHYPPSPDWLTLHHFESVIPPGAAEQLSRGEPLGYGFEWTMDFVAELGRGEEEVIRGFIPIGQTEFDLGYIFLGGDNLDRGMVCHFADYCHRCADPQGLVCLAYSFPEFLSLIGFSAMFGAVHEDFNPIFPNP